MEASKPVQSPAVEAIAPTVPENTSTPPAQQDTKQEPDRMALLARKEKALRAEGRRLQALKAEIEAKPAVNVFDKAKFLQDPTQYGMSNEELSTLLLGQMDQDPNARALNQLRAEIEALKGGQNKALEQVKSVEQQAYDRAIKQISREVETLVSAGDAFEVVKGTGSQEAVVELIKQTYEDEGVLLTAEEAAKEVEDYLLSEAIKLTSLKKIQDRLKPKETAPVAEPEKQAPTPRQQPIQSPTRTLTHTITAGVSNKASNNERRARAIAIMEGRAKP